MPPLPALSSFIAYSLIKKHFQVRGQCGSWVVSNLKEIKDMARQQLQINVLNEALPGEDEDGNLSSLES